MSKNKIITFKDKNNIYLYFKNNIYGFDVRQVSFIGKSIESFMDKIKSLSNVFLEDSNIIIDYKKELLIFNEEIKYIPLIYSLNKNE
jgi:predicted ribosome-associated RNA-binding protein Tma20